MGNKTRKEHNAAGTGAITLEFPFHSVDRATMIFGVNIPGMKEVAAACPPEFMHRGNEWNKFANHIFFNGAQTGGFKFSSPSREIAGMQWAYIEAWLGSWEPKHEVKSAVCGWLLSLMLTECPNVR